MKPIIFNTQMVRAILNGDKTQTRRVIHPQQVEYSDGRIQTLDEFVAKESWDMLCAFAPYNVGDILYVRETFAYWEGTAGAGYIYKADEIHNPPIECCLPDRWRPSIHMPKELARLFLRVKHIKAERIQIISVYDAECEGIAPRDHDRPDYEVIDDFALLWDEVNYKRGYGWEQNPWVWVYDFEVCEKPEESNV